MKIINDLKYIDGLTLGQVYAAMFAHGVSAFIRLDLLCNMDATDYIRFQSEQKRAYGEQKIAEFFTEYPEEVFLNEKKRELTLYFAMPDYQPPVHMVVQLNDFGYATLPMSWLVEAKKYAEKLREEHPGIMCLVATVHNGTLIQISAETDTEIFLREFNEIPQGYKCVLAPDGSVYCLTPRD